MAQLTGKVTKILDEVSGDNGNGYWVRGGFVVESLGDNPRTVTIAVDEESK